MAENFDQIVASCVCNGSVEAQDVAGLRRSIWASDKVSQEAINGLFAINSALTEPSADFTDLFAEAICHALLKQEWPHDFISDEHSSWLINEISRDGRVESHAELEVLIRVVEQAQNVPAELKDFALKQIESVVLSGEGPTRRGQEIHPGRVDAAEVALLRRLVFAGAGDEDNLVGTAEAELFFRLKDATRNADNAPEWKTFFVQAISNHLMAWSSYMPLARHEAARLEGFMDKPSAGVGGFLASVVKSVSLQNLLSGWDKTKDAPGLHAGDEANLEKANRIDLPEASWLRRQIANDSQFDELEKAVLAFIVDEGVALPAELSNFGNGPIASRA